mgnify:CR=1 FL=1
MENNVINAIIEISLHSKNKYEIDELTGRITIFHFKGNFQFF